MPMVESKGSRTVAPYGTWSSPISTDLLVQKNLALSEVLVPIPAEGSSETEILWIENRPSEGGRAALMRSETLSSSDAVDLTRGNHNVRTAVHEYGGGSAAFLADGSVLFNDYNPNTFDVLRASTQPDAEPPKVVTPANKLHRFGDFGPHPTDSNLVLAILEDHSNDTPSKVVNSVVLLDLSASPANVRVLLHGNPGGDAKPGSGANPNARDFYTYPRFSPNGKYVCWVSWNHPSMPWWDTELWVAQLDSSDASSPKLVSPASLRVSGTRANTQEVYQAPTWAIPANPEDDASRLFFTNDSTGYLNLYSVTVSSVSSKALKLTPAAPVLPEPLPNDFSGPCWTLNNSTYVPLGPDMLVVSYTTGARDSLGLVNLRRPRLIPLSSPFVSCSQLRRLSSTSFALLASQVDQPTALVKVDLRGLASSNYVVQPSNITLIKQSSTLISDGTLDRSIISAAKEIEFPTTLPDGKPAVAHAIIFPPTNPDFVAPSGTAPPCIFTIHGGPTSSAGMTLSLQTQFWTSRGFMVCAVNYGGSTGYGREYMERLTGQWGVVDVNDCVAAAQFLGSSASLDPRPFSSLSVEEQAKVRHLIQRETKDNGALQDEKLPGGGVKVTLRSTEPSWTWTDALVGGASVALAFAAATRLPGLLLDQRHCISNTFSLDRTSDVARSAVGATGAAVALLPFVLSKAGSVISEAVSVLPGLGVQLTTTRGLRFPTKCLKLTQSNRLIPRDRILDLYVAEGFKLFSVIDYLALAVSVGIHTPAGKISDVEHANADTGSKGATIERLFPNLVPRLSAVQRAYRTLYPALQDFGADSTGVEGKRGESGSFGSTLSSSSTQAASLADPSSMLISGGSSGGFTVLCALCFHPTVFGGGVSRYGISSLVSLAAESHKFENRYPLQLIGGTPESVPDIYHDRSPINFVSDIEKPILLLQGSDDKIVPPNQAEEMVRQLEHKGAKKEKDFDYVLYPGEGHGFRQAKNIQDSIEKELAWYLENCLHLKK
ncbi:hypothetical protein BCV70DRAFT_226552 [Testicularia cyperi]|uniref:Dipeptidyl-peptidase V n=1 Tax=Testicularia cyperi TaxID=1882483 RepID=A0A317XR02_9BASI|nr:hypothetical protein BCV70DRAFT_226552 [Testicularia cyperi]